MRSVFSYTKNSLTAGSSRSDIEQLQSFEEQRAVLARALATSEAILKVEPVGSSKYLQAKDRVVHLQNELRVLKGRMKVVRKKQNLGDFLIQMFKERVTRSEWERIVVEARRRHESQGFAS